MLQLKFVIMFELMARQIVPKAKIHSVFIIVSRLHKLMDWQIFIEPPYFFKGQI